MSRLRTRAAVLLLAVFAVGGIGMPVLHEMAHAAEAADALAHHADADHQHHADPDHHGAEIDASCPESLCVDLTCSLCAATSASVVSASTAFEGITGEMDRLGTEAESALVRGDTTPEARGPPRSRLDRKR